MCHTTFSRKQPGDIAGNRFRNENSAPLVFSSFHYTTHCCLLKVIALGDEENDVEMLRAVGHGIAMGQAVIGVRRAARFTAPTNELDGVAVALETFCGM